MRSRIVAALAGLAVFIAVPGTAGAHAVLRSSFPAASSTVTNSPTRIELRFNEGIEKSLASIRLFDESRREITIGKATRSPSDTTLVLAEDVPRLDDGVYVVIWRVTSGDGHPVNGAFAFQVGSTPSTIDPATVGKVVGGLHTRSNLGVPLGVGKFLAYLGVLALIGAVVLSWRDPLAAGPRLVGIEFVALVSMTFGTGAVLMLQGAYASGRSWSSVFEPTLISDVLSTRLGAALAFRVALCVVWLVLLAKALRGVTERAWWLNTTALVSCATIVTFAVSGHASGQRRAWLWIALDSVHLASVAAWAGALAVLALVVRHGDGNVADVSNRFSRMAGVTMPAAVLSGGVLGFGIVGAPGRLVESEYGRILLAKVAIVLAVIALGARARGRLARDGVSDARGTIRLESVLVAVVLAVTAVLVGASPAATPGAPPSVEAQLVQGNVWLDLQIVPARVGTAEVHALFTPPEGTLAPVRNVRVSFSLGSKDVPPIPVTMVELGPNHFSGVVRIPWPGAWRVEVRANPKENVNLLFATVARIEG